MMPGLSLETAVTSVIDLNPSRPLIDKKDYKLASFSNGLEVLLISTNGRRDRAAASMTVNVGSFSDPADVEGLAHYLEHMVFMGSDKYPEENAYDAFVDGHGGFCNAMTDGEYTNYVFNVDSEYLDEAFDIFANCFIAPKLSTDSSERELKAIDSEFHLAEMSDGSRSQEVLCSSTVKGHFFRKFSWGNLRSLKEQPASKGININVELRRFFETYYTPDNMKLVVISPRSTDHMLRMVETSFGHWESTRRQRLDRAGLPLIPKATYSGFPFDTAHPTLARYQPIKNIHRVEIHWLIPICNEALHYRKKGPDYVSHLLGDEGHGSLLSFLKAKGYATGLTAGVGSDSFSKNTKFSLFELSITLTVCGLSNWMDVVGHVYSYLGLIDIPISGPPKRIFDEMKSMAQINYDYGDEEEESDFVEELSIRLARRDPNCPPLELLPSEDLFFDWDPIGVQDTLACLTPVNGHIHLFSSVFKHTPLSRSEGGAPSEDSDEWEDIDDDDDEAGADAFVDPIKAVCGHKRDRSERAVKGLIEDDDEDEEDESDDGSSDDLSDGDASGDGSSEGDTAGVSDHVPNLEEVSALYKGPDRWRELADPLRYFSKDSKTHLPELCVEQNFGTKFWLDVIPDDLLEAWDSWNVHSFYAIGGTGVGDVNLALPPPNIFIPSTVRESSCSDEDSFSKDSQMLEIPRMVLFPELNQRLSAYHFTDECHRWIDVPKVVISLKFSSLLVPRSIHSHIAMDLVTLMLQDSLNEFLYMASVAGISYEFASNDVGFTIVTSGFKDKILHLLTDIINEVFNKDFNFASIARYERQCEVLLRYYGNQAVKAGSAATLTRKLALLPYEYSGYDCSQVLSYLKNSEGNREKIIHFMDNFLRSLVVDVLIHGSYPEVSLKSLLGAISSSLDYWRSNTEVVEITSQRSVSVVRLPPQSVHVLRSKPRSPLEKNICVEIYFQAKHFDVPTVSMLNLLEQILSEPFFNELRTKQQLGYSVSCGSRNTFGIPGFCFNVVSSAHDIATVQASMLTFIQDVIILLETMDEESYNNHLASVINDLKTPDVSISEQSSRFWSEIADRTMRFSMVNDAIEFFKIPPTKTELISFYCDLFIPSLAPESHVRCIVVECSADATNVSIGKTLSGPDLFGPIGPVKYLDSPSDLHLYAVTTVM